MTRLPLLPLLPTTLWPLLLAAAALATGVIPWQEAGDHTGSLVTVEGHVARAETRESACILRFDPDDERALRVLLLIPLVTNLPPAPHRLYEHRRIRATGRIRRFGGRLEMVLQSPDQLEVLGLTPEAGEATPGPVAEEHTPPAAAPPTPAPVRPPPALPSPVEVACAHARDAWQQAHAEARRAVADLDTCLAAGALRCAPLGDRLGPALTELDWAEQRLQATCPPAGGQ